MSLSRTGALVRGSLALRRVFQQNHANPNIRQTNGSYHSLQSSQLRRWTHSESGTESEMQRFPDPSIPQENPLAPLSQESLQKDSKYWERAKKSTTPKIYVRKVDENGEAFGKGGRKRSKARVWISPGIGNISVNERSWVDYFTRIDHRDKILRPLQLCGMTGKMDVRCTVHGGGQTGQAEAIRFCLARAVQNWDPAMRPRLKKDGLLTRDSRIVEMKKFGKKKARKSFQWVKR